MSLNERIAYRIGAEVLGRLVAEERVSQLEAELAEKQKPDAEGERRGGQESG